MRLRESNRLLILLYPLQEKTITTSGYTIVTINRNTIVTVNRITIVKSICWLTRRFRHCHQAALDIWTHFVSHAYAALRSRFSACRFHSIRTSTDVKHYDNCATQVIRRCIQYV